MSLTQTKVIVVVTLMVAMLAACGKGDGNDASPGAAVNGTAATEVTAARLIAANTEPGNWMSHGRTYDEQRFSPLAEIDRENVGDLGLAWYFDVPTHRGMEATPIVVDGRMYVTGSWSSV